MYTAQVMGRKPQYPEGTKIRVGLALPPHLLAKLDLIAKRKGWTRTAALEKIIDLAVVPKETDPT